MNHGAPGGARLGVVTVIRGLPGGLRPLAQIAQAKAPARAGAKKDQRGWFCTIQWEKASMMLCRKGRVFSDNWPASSKKLPAPPR